MTVIPFPKLHASRKKDAPLAVFAHMLPDLSDTDIAFDPEQLETCIVNMTVGLIAARRLGLQVAHIILTPDDRQADRLKNGLTASLPELRALPTEAVFTCNYPSIFSNSLVDDYLQQYGHSKLALFGFSANDVGLMSVIEGSRRNYDMVFIRDCSPLFSIENCSVEMSEAVIFGTIGHFSSVETVSDFVKSIAGPEALSSPELPLSKALVEPESLKCFIAHSAGEAERLGFLQCAGRLLEAKALLEHEPEKETMAGEH